MPMDGVRDVTHGIKRAKLIGFALLRIDFGPCEWKTTAGSRIYGKDSPVLYSELFSASRSLPGGKVY